MLIFILFLFLPGFLLVCHRSDSSSCSSCSNTPHFRHERLVVTLKVLVSEEEVSILLVTSFWDAYLAKAPAIELSGKRRELSFSEEERQKVINKLVSVLDDERMTITNPIDACDVIASVSLIFNIAQQKHQLNTDRRHREVAIPHSLLVTVDFLPFVGNSTWRCFL